MGKKLTIEQMQAIAKNRGGKCLSNKYVNAHTDLLWECSKGHRWKATSNNVKNGKSWCPKCKYVTNLTIEEMRAIAKSRGGKCLSKKYVNGNTKLKWECKEKHQWMAAPASIKFGRWCPQCSGNVRLTLKEMKELAKSRGGKCLSKKYVNSSSKLKWECSNKHPWFAMPYVVKQGTWCPECSSKSNISERICRAYFEQIFENQFPKSYPEWLNGLELDGYCERLRLAFEHQGEDHYSTKGRHVRTKKKLLELQKRDKRKSRLCKKHNVRLIAIPELSTRTKLEDLNSFIYKKCKQLKVRRPSGMLHKEINLKNAWISNHNKKMLEEVRQIAKSRGGQCLSKKYINSKDKLRFKCAEGHLWSASANSIKRNNWCKKCSDKRIGLESRSTIQEMKKIAKSRGGKCLSKEYVDAHTILRWECAKGHCWEAKPNTIKNGHWCLECAGCKKNTIEEMQEIAKSRGGKCLSKKYVGAHSDLRWECSKGHRWKARPSNVKNGKKTWCPKCKYEARKKYYATKRKHKS